MTAARFTESELLTLADIAHEQDPDRAIRRLREAFTDPNNPDDDLLHWASEAVDRLRNGLPVPLGNGEVFMRDSGGPSGQVLRAGPAR
jgi:hypothetical protein